MSTKLNCSAQNCVHNTSGLCTANTIQVAGSAAHTSSSTQCDTFAEKGFVNAVTNMTNMNIPGEIKQLFNRNSIELSPYVKCEATNCMHNVDRVCGASNIEVYGPGASDSQGTQCETFAE